MMWVAAFVIVGATVCNAGQKIQLFDGKTLNGWSSTAGRQVPCRGRVHRRDHVPKSPNSFLCTDKEFGDFILDFEVKLDNPGSNSGVQFRSQIAPTELAFWFRDQNGKPWQNVIPKDRVYGYQAEIATEKTGTSGGIYDEARRAFMMYDVRATPASKAFKDGQWNKVPHRVQGQYHQDVHQ
jgi:hypothetical protein